MGIEDVPTDVLEKLLTAVETRLPYGNRMVQLLLSAGVLAFIAFCYGVIAPVVAQVLGQISGASAAMPAVRPTVWQWIIFGVMLAMATLVGWRISRTVAEARETKNLLHQLDELSMRAKQEGDRLSALRTEHPSAATFVTTARPKPGVVERRRIPDGEFNVSAQRSISLLQTGNPHLRSVTTSASSVCSGIPLISRARAGSLIGRGSRALLGQSVCRA